MPGSGFGMMRCWTAQNVAPAPMPSTARMLVTAMAAMAPSESPSEGVSGLEVVVVVGAGLSGAACAGAATPSASEQARAAAIVVFLMCTACHVVGEKTDISAVPLKIVSIRALPAAVLSFAVM